MTSPAGSGGPDATKHNYSRAQRHAARASASVVAISGSAVDLTAITDLQPAPSAGRLLFLARSTRSIAQLQALDKMPIRINQAALGCLGPAQDTCLSPSHAIHFAGSLVEAGALINGTSIQQLDDWPDASLTYYNIELERHGLITANGLLVESYFANYRSNGFSRDCWDNYHDYVALYGAGELMEELPLPRIAFARQIPMQLCLSLQLHEDNYKAAKPAIAASGVDPFACLCL